MVINDVKFDKDLFLRLPTPAIQRILQFLRFPEIVVLAECIPEINQYYDLHMRWMNRQFLKRPAFRWTRCAPGDEIMAGRKCHCMAYLPSTNSIYCFGGEAIGGEEGQLRHASFNDLWRFELATRRWSRVNVTRPPYPLPKCDASMVVWAGKIVLFGGYYPLPPGNVLRTYNSSQNEMHMFDPETNLWKQIIPINEGPNVSGHTAVVCKDKMIVYGGWNTDFGLNEEGTILYCFDFIEQSWETIELYSDRRFTGPLSLSQSRLQPGERFFPSMHPAKSTLVLIRDGLILITGEMIENDYGSAILVEFRCLDGVTRWRWKRIKTSGRWWNSLTIDGHPNGICSMPNHEFYEVGVVSNGNVVRLVSLGRVEGDRQVIRSSLTVRYEGTQKRSREIVRVVRERLEREFVNRIERIEDEFENSIHVEHDGIRLELQNCFLSREKLRQLMDAGTEQIHSMEGLRINIHENFPPETSDFDYDDVDLWELRVHLRAMIAQLHAKYYPGRIDGSMCAHLPMRNHVIRRLAVYTAEIPTDIEFDSFEEFKWTPQPQQYRAAPETTNYSLIGANHEVVMHGGCFVFNESMRRMGHTYILEPARSAPAPTMISSPKPILWLGPR